MTDLHQIACLEANKKFLVEYREWLVDCNWMQVPDQYGSMWPAGKPVRIRDDGKLVVRVVQNPC